MRPGDVIDGTYQVEYLLGEGGMGLVVCARHLPSGARVAIKLLKPDTDEIHLRRFFREMRGASQLRNPHVAHVMACGQLPDHRPFMVMELLDGPDLDTVLCEGTLPQAQAVRYIMQACAGLAEAHALGMVHRDIKPANLMLSRAPSGEKIVKVVDFGIATAAHNDKLDAEITAAFTVVGSVNYMSPEQLRSSSDELDARSDVWQLGVVLYELISGRKPFPGERFGPVSIAIATEPHAPLVEAEPGLAAIVDRCLAKDREARYRSVAELAKALAPYAGVQLAAPARPTQNLPKIAPIGARIAERRPRRGLLAAGIAAVAIAACAVFALSTPALEGAASAAPAPKRAITVEPIVEPIAPPTVEPIEPAPSAEAVAPAQAAPAPAKKLAAKGRRAKRR